jgi:hypothetical protein
MQLRRLILAYFKCPVSRLMQKKRSKEGYRRLKQGKLSMREFVTLDDMMAREVKQAGVQMSDQTRIELVEEKISSSALKAMEKYKDVMITMGQFDATMYDDWLAHSNVLMQVCSEMNFGDSDEDGDETDEHAGKIASSKFRRMATNNPPQRRQLDRNQIVAIDAYAAAHGKSFSDVSLEAVIADSGVEKWAVAAAKATEAQLGMERFKEQLAENARVREATGGKMLAIEPSADGQQAPKKYFPMLMPRQKESGREAKVYFMASRAD